MDPVYIDVVTKPRELELPLRHLQVGIASRRVRPLVHLAVGEHSEEMDDSLPQPRSTHAQLLQQGAIHLGRAYRLCRIRRQVSLDRCRSRTTPAYSPVSFITPFARPKDEATTP